MMAQYGPNFTMVGNLSLPKGLLQLIETGRWPRTEEKEPHQNIRPVVFDERIRSLAADQDRIYFVSPPFSTVAKEGEFWSRFGALEHIDPDLSLLIGDFGLGSDSTILLDSGQDSS